MTKAYILGRVSSIYAIWHVFFWSKIIAVPPQAIYISKKMGETYDEIPSDNFFVT